MSDLTLLEYVISIFFVSRLISTPFENPKTKVFIAAHIAVIFKGPLFLLFFVSSVIFVKKLESEERIPFCGYPSILAISAAVSVASFESI
jgi:hypothetical protein